MARYVLKILVDLEARDDLAARQSAASLVAHAVQGLEGVREIVLHAREDHKSIRIGADGSFQGEWKPGGAAMPPGPRAASGASPHTSKQRGGRPEA